MSSLKEQHSSSPDCGNHGEGCSAVEHGSPLVRTSSQLDDSNRCSDESSERDSAADEPRYFCDRHKFYQSDFFLLWGGRFPVLNGALDVVFPWLCYYIGFCTGVAWVFRQAYAA